MYNNEWDCDHFFPDNLASVSVLLRISLANFAKEENKKKQFIYISFRISYCNQPQWDSRQKIGLNNKKQNKKKGD